MGTALSKAFSVLWPSASVSSFPQEGPWEPRPPGVVARTRPGSQLTRPVLSEARPTGNHSAPCPAPRDPAGLTLWLQLLHPLSPELAQELLEPAGEELA